MMLDAPLNRCLQYIDDLRKVVDCPASWEIKHGLVFSEFRTLDVILRSCGVKLKGWGTYDPKYYPQHYENEVRSFMERLEEVEKELRLVVESFEGTKEPLKVPGSPNFSITKLHEWFRGYVWTEESPDVWTTTIGGSVLRVACESEVGKPPVWRASIWLDGTPKTQRIFAGTTDTRSLAMHYAYSLLSAFTGV